MFLLSTGKIVNFLNAHINIHFKNYVRDFFSMFFRFADYGQYFEIVNHFANPHYVLEILFPLISILDSVFAAQLLLCMSFGGWMNAVLKW